MSFFTRYVSGWALLLTAVMVVAVPSVSYAQVGKSIVIAATDALTDAVMKELENEFWDIVAKEPISETAKANVVKKFSEMARPIVKKFISGVTSGKLPNPIELAKTVMKEVLPHMQELITAAKTVDDSQVVASTYSAPQARQVDETNHTLQMQQTQDMLKIAVYVSGSEDPAINKAMANGLITTLVNSKRYQAAENYKEFFEQAVEEQNGGAGSMKYEQIKKLGDRFDVRYVCISEIVAVLGECQVSARIVDVETGESMGMTTVGGQLKSQVDIANASEQIVSEMLKKTLPPAQMAEVPLSQTPQYMQETSPVETVYESKPQLSTKSKKRVSFGFGSLFTNDYGSIMEVNGNSEEIMPNYDGLGVYLFFDAIYAEFYTGYTIPKGYVNATDANIGMFLKWPIGDGLFRFFPLAGVDWELSRYGETDFSAMWFKIGVGCDIKHVFSHRLYSRIELMYGLRTENKIEKDRFDAMSSFLNVKKTKSGNGLTFKIGIGWEVGRSQRYTNTNKSDSNFNLRSDAVCNSNYDTFTDSRDGKVYKVVDIGGKKWMAENLNYEDNNRSFRGKYGRLYPWNTAKIACPEGWHLPTRQDWNHLAHAVGGKEVQQKIGDIDLIRYDSAAGTRLKSNVGWMFKETYLTKLTPIKFNLIPGTDEFCFSALPGGGGAGLMGVRGLGGTSSLGLWWTATEVKKEYAYALIMTSYEEGMGEGVVKKELTNAVRCVCDD